MNSIITFYSFKGGVGRSMALANVALLLAQRGKQVLAVDWDLEAPGLGTYFRNQVSTADSKPGLLDCLATAAGLERRTTDGAHWKDCVHKVEVTGKGRLDLITAGRMDATYIDQLSALDWNAFFRDKNGGEFIESLRNDWSASYDLTLIDSRTGFTDAGGVCTIQMPDILVLVFNASHQSLKGAADAALRAQASRRILAYERTPLLVVPLPSRWDGRVEVDLSKQWLDKFVTEMSGFYDGWLPSGTPVDQIIEHTKVPHVGKFSFGESLPVLTESLTDPEGIAVVYERLAALIDADFENADQVLLGRRYESTTQVIGPELGRLMEDLAASIQDELDRMRIQRVRKRLLTVAPGILAVLLLIAQVFVFAPVDRVDLLLLLVTLLVVIAAVWSYSVAAAGYFAAEDARRKRLERLEESLRSAPALSTKSENLRSDFERYRAEFYELKSGS